MDSRNLDPAKGPDFVITGDWPVDQLRLLDCSDGSRAAIIGDCWAPQADIEQALASGRSERIMDLPGNFSAVVSLGGEIAAFNSLSGDHPLYYGQTKDGPIISTRPILGTDLALDKPYLTAQLVMAGAGESIFADHSSFEGVSKLPGGHGVRIVGDNVEPFVHTSLAPQPGTSFEEAAAQLREALASAVEARVASSRPISADLSGGMDSTSIAFLALRSLDDHRSLPVFFANPPNPDAGDAPYMEQALGLEPRFKGNRFTETQVQDIGRFDHATMVNLPVPEDLASAMSLGSREKIFFQKYYQFINACRGEGGGMHLTGWGGDEVTGSHALYLADAWRAGDLRRFFTDGLGYARLLNLSPLNLWRSMAQLGHQGLSGTLLQAAHLLEHLPDGDNEPNALMGLCQPGGPGLQWLTPNARRELAEVLSAKAHTESIEQGLGIGDFINLTTIRSAGNFMQALRQYLRASGSLSSPQAPFLDHDVIRAGCELAAKHKAGPHEFKRLARAALAGLVPPEVLSRRSKGFYDASAAQSAIASEDAIRELLREPLLADLGIIDPLKMRGALLGIGTASITDLWTLERVVNAELFLQGLTRQGSLPTPQASSRPHITISAALPPETLSLPQGYLTVPPYIHAVASSEGALVIFNRQTDQCKILDHTRSEIIRALTAEGSAEAAIESMKATYPTVDPQIIGADVAQCCQELLTAGILQISEEPPSGVVQWPTTTGRIRFTSEDKIVARERPANIRLKDRLLAAVGLTVGMVALKGLKPEQRLPFLQRIQSARHTRGATHEEATRIVRAVQSLPYLGRLACLDTQYAALLTAALVGVRVDWHQGVSFGPLSYHAWLEAEGRPVTTEYDGRVAGNYQSFYDQSLSSPLPRS